MSEHQAIIQEFFDQYQGSQYRHEIRKGIREDHVVAIVTDTVNGHLYVKEVSTRQWVDHA